MANGGLFVLINEELGDSTTISYIQQLKPDLAAATRINTRMVQYWRNNQFLTGRKCLDYTPIFYQEGATLLDYPVFKFDEPDNSWTRSTFFTDIETATAAADSLPEGLAVAFQSYWGVRRSGLYLYVGGSGQEVSEEEFYLPGFQFDPASAGDGE